MKKFSILLVVLLALTALSSADQIKLTSGSGQIYPLYVFPGYTFHFHGSGYDFSIPQFLDLFNGALVNCIPCDPTHLGNPLFVNPLFIAGGPFLYLGNQVLDGIIQFDAVSLVSSLAPNGILTVKYTATPFLYLFLSDLTTGATLTSTPEPTTMILTGTGMLAILCAARKQFARSQRSR